ncbi:hypothetical protein [Halocatena halophila]|uniref:hypothetical protein n=1 Tax=Halocatena halophila TaxID=2814576 RepID=UPI002ED2EAC9
MKEGEKVDLSNIDVIQEYGHTTKPAWSLVVASAGDSFKVILLKDDTVRELIAEKQSKLEALMTADKFRTNHRVILE